MCSKCLYIALFFSTVYQLEAQSLELFTQFNGRYDFVVVGNSMNPGPNNSNSTPCTILTASSADLTLGGNDTVAAAFLYWAGMGAGDGNVKLNGQSVQAEQILTQTLETETNSYLFYQAVADVSHWVQEQGNGSYTLSEFTTNPELPVEEYCEISVNFGGWALLVVYENPEFPLAQLNIYEGYEILAAERPELELTLEDFEVSDSAGAKVGFMVWEGDAQLNQGESIEFNGNSLTDFPVNPAHNIFNSSSSYTGSQELWNMDLDFFPVEEYLATGDTRADLKITTRQDMVLLSNITTLIRSQLPDATIHMNRIETVDCETAALEVDLVVMNTNSTAPLPAGTPIAFYANDVFFETSHTLSEIPIGGSEAQSLWLALPNLGSLESVVLTASADDLGEGNGLIRETNENNNTHTVEHPIPLSPELIDLFRCEHAGIRPFNLWDSLPPDGSTADATFHTSEADAHTGLNPIVGATVYVPSVDFETIYLRMAGEPCDFVGSFSIQTLAPQQTQNETWQQYSLSGSPGRQTLELHHETTSRFAYALDNPSDFQDSPVFQNLSEGIYQAYVWSLDDCQYVAFRVYVLEFPNYFTPNNDGHNDHWQIQGWDNDKLNLMSVSIFDRYGHLVHKLNLNTAGWDGTYNGRPVPQDDYWFKAVFHDGHEQRGHFTLKR